MNIQTMLSWALYLSILVGCTFLMKKAQQLWKAGSKRYWWLLGTVFLALAVPVALRAETVGFDTHEYVEYYRYFLQVGNLNFRDNMEPLYELFVRIAALAGNPHVVFILAALATIFFMMAGLWWLRDQLDLGLVMFFYLCFFYLQTFNVVRQCFAVAILFFAFRFISERKFILYVLFVYLAYLMHSAAIIGLLLYPMGSEKLSMKTKKLLCLLAALAVLITISPYLVPLLKEVTKISVFAAYGQHISDAHSRIGSSWLLRAVIIFGAILLSDSFRTKEGTRSTALFATAISLPFLIVNYLIPPIGRAGAYFSIFNVITFASFAGRKTEKPFLPKMENALIVAFALVTFLMSLYSDGMELIPYSTFFS